MWIVPALFLLAGAAIGAMAALVWRAPAPTSLSTVRELTFSGLDSDPAASPDGRTIAFTSSRDGRSRIWVKQLQTGGEEWRTEGSDRKPRFFHNGAALLFVRSNGTDHSIWRVPLVGGIAQLLIEDAVEADPSPIDDRIAFLRIGRDEKPFVTTLMVTTPGNGEPVAIATITNAELTSLRWSPDGRTIAAVRRSPQGLDTALVFVDVESRAMTEVEAGPEPGAFGALAWNGDGSSVIATRAEDAQVNMPGGLDRVVRVPRGGGRQETLLFVPNLFGPFRSVGNNGRIEVAGPGRLVFHSVETRQTLRETGFDSPHPEQLRLTTTGNAHDRQPAYSPDGNAIIFTSNRSGNYDLWIASTVSGQLSQLTDDPAQDRDPAFSPDGKYILFSSNRGGHLEVWRQRLDRTELRQISHDGVDAENPTMGGDSPWVVYASRKDPAKLGIWRVKLDGTEATRIVTGDLSLPEVSPDGKYVLYRELDRPSQMVQIHVVELATGNAVPFDITIPYQAQQATGNVTWGRARWMPDSKAMVFVGQDERGLACLFHQDFVPGRDTIATRRRIKEPMAQSGIESFGISPTGKWIVVADEFSSQSLKLADGVFGILAPGRR
jgi:Tol biopolymer transport system component